MGGGETNFFPLVEIARFVPSDSIISALIKGRNRDPVWDGDTTVPPADKVHYRHQTTNHIHTPSTDLHPKFPPAFHSPSFPRRAVRCGRLSAEWYSRNESKHDGFPKSERQPSGLFEKEISGSETMIFFFFFFFQRETCQQFKTPQSTLMIRLLPLKVYDLRGLRCRPRFLL